MIDQQIIETAEAAIKALRAWHQTDSFVPHIDALAALVSQAGATAAPAEIPPADSQVQVQGLDSSQVQDKPAEEPAADARPSRRGRSSAGEG